MGRQVLLVVLCVIRVLVPAFASVHDGLGVLPWCELESVVQRCVPQIASLEIYFQACSPCTDLKVAFSPQRQVIMSDHDVSSVAAAAANSVSETYNKLPASQTSHAVGTGKSYFFNRQRSVRDILGGGKCTVQLRFESSICTVCCSRRVGMVCTPGLVGIMVLKYGCQVVSLGESDGLCVQRRTSSFGRIRLLRPASLLVLQLPGSCWNGPAILC